MIHRRRDEDEDDHYRDPAPGDADPEIRRAALQERGDLQRDQDLRAGDDRPRRDSGDLLFRYNLYNG